MNQFVNAVRQIPDSVTENGAATFSSSLDTHVDLFFRVGASRGKVHEVVQLFKKAFIENAVSCHSHRSLGARCSWRCW